MLLLDDNTPSLIAAAAAQKNGATPPPPQDEFGQMVQAHDSISNAIKDSLRSMDVSDLKAVVTGENTILRDGLHELTQLTVQFIPKLIVAILILWIGLKLTKMLKKVIVRALDKRGAEPSLKSFLGSLSDVLLKAMIIIMAMDVIGIKATSFIALLGAMGLAVGMALQGTLQNFAGGVIILLMKPFKVDDYIECGQYKGYIKEIRIFHTIMRPFNGRTIIIPNSELATKSLIRWPTAPTSPRPRLCCGMSSRPRNSYSGSPRNPAWSSASSTTAPSTSPSGSGSRSRTTGPYGSPSARTYT